jgi:histidinol-phosphate/aromatic aminotransferase/cobyric acid decarboxylase-like protein
MIELRFGEIPDPLPERLLGRISKQALQGINRYPSNYGKLVLKLAKLHRIGEKNIVLVNGVDEAIDLVARAFGQKITIFTPTYYEFCAAAQRNNLKCSGINCFDGKNYFPKYDSTPRDCTLLFLCNPNNPFGTLQKKEVVALAQKTKAMVAVDETYIDFAGETLIKEAANCKNLLVFRSFSKGFCLAGLRIGYVVGNEKAIKKIMQRKLCFNVSSVAVEAALLALDEKSHFKKLAKSVMKRKAAFEKFLKAMGFDVKQSSIPKIFMRFRAPKQAIAFQRILEKNGFAITVGNGISTCGLDKSFAQFSCGTEKQMRQLKEIIKNSVNPDGLEKLG